MKQLTLILALLLTSVVVHAQSVIPRDVEIHALSRTLNGDRETLSVEIKNTGNWELLSPTIAVLSGDTVLATTQKGFVNISTGDTHTFELTYPKAENTMIQFEDHRGFKKNLNPVHFEQKASQNLALSPVELSEFDLAEGKKTEFALTVKNMGTVELVSPRFDILDPRGNVIGTLEDVYSSLPPDSMRTFVTPRLKSKQLKAGFWVRFTDANGFLKNWEISMAPKPEEEVEPTVDLDALEDKHFISNKIPFNKSQIDPNLIGEWRMTEYVHEYAERSTTDTYKDADTAPRWNLTSSGKSYFQHANAKNGLWRYYAENEELCILDYVMHEGKPLENKMIYKVIEVRADRLILHRTFFGGFERMVFEKVGE
ncbi:MAG: hypothetical protein AAF570_06055 [Bacteroidota bacterium]